MTNLRERPMRLEMWLTRDYINRAQKMREIEARVQRDDKLRGWRLVGVWLLVLGFCIGIWIAGGVWILQ